MRIAHIITRLIVGGAQENTLASALGLAAKPGWEVELISGPTEGPEGSLENWLEGSRPVRLRIVRSLIRPVHPWHDLQAYLALTRVLRASRPDMVHTHSGKAGVLGRWAARSARIQTIVHTIHGPSFGPFQGRLANAAFRGAERAAGRCTHHYVAVAQAMIDQYLAAGLGRPDDYTLIRSGFDTRPFAEARRDPAVRAGWGIGEDDFVVGTLSRLAPLKGMEDLISAAPLVLERVPRAKFLMVGDGSLRGVLEAEIRRLGLERAVVFAGLVRPEEVPGCVAQMDVLAHLSRREGLPRALPQALAAGKPVVAFDVDGAREVCLDGEHGFLLKAGDVRGLSERLVELAEKPELRRRFGEQGRRWVASRFSVETMVDSLEALYRRLAGRTDLEPRPSC
ncbi:MAG: glycosyltransferase family 4 protein [Verrucomicrobia bacterium]|nr:glycosyltransferase family 4 protein [Verrucomicrobiota bacterium]